MTLKKIGVAAGVLALVAVIGLLVVVPTLAQTATPPAQTKPPMLGGRAWGGGLGMWGRGGSWTLFDAEAKALNLTPTQLFDQLHSGKSLSEIAQAQGIDLQTVRNAALAAANQTRKDAINQAVKDGRITQAQADWLLQGLDQGFLGRGFGNGMRGGMRRFNGRGPAQAPTAPASPTAPAPGTTS